MPTDTAMTGYYARRASEYDRVYEKPERQADLGLLKRRVTELLRGRSVFEAACGTGWWTQHYAAAAASVFATDINDEVLALAQSRGLLAEAVVFSRADAFSLPAAPWPCDAGFAGFWWSHLRRKDELRAFLEHFLSRLEPGARFVFIDNAFVEGSSTPISRTDEDGNSYQLRTLANGETQEVLKNFPTQREVRLALAGLAGEVQWEPLPYYWLVWGSRR